MSGTALILAIVIPVLAVAGFSLWLWMIYYADHHHHKDETALLDYTVKGGAFQGSGGRQVMPRRDAVPPEALRYEPDALNDERAGPSSGAGAAGPAPADHRRGE